MAQGPGDLKYSRFRHQDRIHGTVGKVKWGWYPVASGTDRAVGQQSTTQICISEARIFE